MAPEWLSLLSPIQWAVLAALPPAVAALYFLKLRRRPLVVPSTYLWRRSLEDLHVNSLWQRLRQNLLLYLQLLVLALAILALARPVWRGSRLAGDRFIFLVDNSASMSATDVAPNRLAEARRRVGELIDQLPAGAVGMLVSFADQARVEQTFTDNRRALRRALAGIRPTQQTTDLGEALRVAAGLANPGRVATEAQDMQVADALPATVYIVSDGQFPDVAGFSLGNLEPRFIPIGSAAAENLGIVAFNTRRNAAQGGALEAFARVEFHGAAPSQAELSLWADGVLIDAQAVEVAPDKSASAVFALGQRDSGVLELRASPDDVLPLDNRAWTTIDPPRQVRVLVIGPGNEPLEFALQTRSSRELAEVRFEGPEFLTTPEYAQRSLDGSFDLIVYDRTAPPTAPAAQAMYWGAIPPGGAWRAGEPLLPQIIDADLSHPICQLLELWNIDLVEGFVVEPPVGGRGLVQCQAGPLVAIGPREGFEDLVLGFSLVNGDKVNTNWPLRVSFPLFVLNVLRYFGPEEEAGSTGARPGQVVELSSQGAADRLTVVDPAGEARDVRRAAGGRFPFAGGELVGPYTVREAGRPPRSFALNLFSPAESQLAAKAENSIRIGYVEVEARAGREATPREAWKWLALAVLVMLLAEWYIYNRRVYL